VTTPEPTEADYGTLGVAGPVRGVFEYIIRHPSGVVVSVAISPRGKSVRVWSDGKELT
jgi:hypothetical protein